eukprot:659971-Pelagomonas_calceolata.AAC.4
MNCQAIECQAFCKKGTPRRPISIQLQPTVYPLVYKWWTLVLPHPSPSPVVQGGPRARGGRGVRGQVLPASSPLPVGGYRQTNDRTLRQTSSFIEPVSELVMSSW